MPKEISTPDTLASPKWVLTYVLLIWKQDVMYFLILPLLLYFIEIRLVKSVLILAFLILAELFSILARNFLTLVILLIIMPLNASEVTFFMIIKHMQFDLSHLSISLFSLVVVLSIRDEGESILNIRLRSMTPRTIKKILLSWFEVSII